MLAAEAYANKLRKRIKAIRREIKAVKQGLGSVQAEAEEQDEVASENDVKDQQAPAQQVDLQRATMLNRLSALRAKQRELQARQSIFPCVLPQRSSSHVLSPGAFMHTHGFTMVRRTARVCYTHEQQHL